jgi:hypothetical protein
MTDRAWRWLCTVMAIVLVVELVLLTVGFVTFAVRRWL